MTQVQIANKKSFKTKTPLIAIEDQSRKISYEAFKNKRLVSSIFTVINEILNENRNTMTKQALKTQMGYSFFSKSSPSVELLVYIERVLKYTLVESSTFIVALIYLDRICSLTKISLCDYNIYRLFLTALVIAIKYNEDDYYNNTFYCKIGGIKLEELNQLEADFVKQIKFELFISDDTYFKYSRYLNEYNNLEC